MKMMKTFAVAGFFMMAMPVLSATYYVRVIGGYKHLKGRVVIIKCMVEENELGIKDFLRRHSSYAIKNPVIQRYMEQNPPHDGTVYYGADGTDHYYFHETWIKVLPPQEAKSELLKQEEALLTWVSPDGTVFSTNDLAFGDDNKDDDDDSEDGLFALTFDEDEPQEKVVP